MSGLEGRDVVTAGMSGSSARTLWYGLKVIARHFYPLRWRIGILFLLITASAVANAFVPLLTGMLLDAIAQSVKGSTQPYHMLAFAITVQVLASVWDWLANRQGRHLSVDVGLAVTVQALNHLMRLPIAYHHQSSANANFRKITEASGHIGMAVRMVALIVPQLLAVVVGIAMAVTISVPLCGVLLLSMGLYLLLMRRHISAVAALDRRVRDAQIRSWADATAAISLIDVVKQAAAEDLELRNLREIFQVEMRGHWYGVEAMWSNSALIQRSITVVTLAVTFLIAVYYVRVGELTIGQLVAFNAYAVMFLAPVASFSGNWQWIQNGATSASQLDDMLREPQEFYNPGGAAPCATSAVAVAFESVTFRYQADAQPALIDISFEVPLGSVVAIVGESGSGKSTLASLLSGYYFPDQGRVMVGGVDVRKADLQELRKFISVVPQEFPMFNKSIRDNICYGVEDVSKARIAEVIKAAQMEEFLLRMPNGIDTKIGERGALLSVGQKQRMAIARAILRDPSILILDEPTSALDAQTERLITEALDAAFLSRTVFVIAHRLSTTRKADVILVLDKGQLREVGDHASLVSRTDGLYRYLYEHHVGLR